MVTFVFLIFAVLSLLLAMVILAFTVIGLVGEWLGAPFVPTSGKIVDEILAGGKLKKGQRMVELGSGDGRMLRRAAKMYGVVGTGVEIHPMLVWYSNAMVHFQKLKGVKFVLGDFYKTDLTKCQVLFIFLLPKTIKKLQTKFEELPKGCTIISHGFEIKYFKDNQVGYQDRKMFGTYFYRV